MGKYISAYRGVVREQPKKKKYISGYSKREKNKGGVAEGVGYIGANLGLGALSVAEGILDVAQAGGDVMRGDLDMAKRRFLDNQTAEAREKLNDWYNPGTIMKGAGDVASGIGNSLTFMIPYAGPYLAAAGYTGMGISSAAEKTGNVGLKEVGYGAVSGGLEFALDSVLGGAGKAAKNLGASITRKVGREAAETGAKATAKLAGKSFGKSVLAETLKGAGGEAAEEAASEFIDPLLQKLFNIDENAETSLANVMYAGLIGGLSGGLMTAGPAAINYKSAVKVGKEIRESGETDDFIRYAQTVLKGAERKALKYKDAADKKITADKDAGLWGKAVTGLQNVAGSVENRRGKSSVEKLAETVQKNLNTLDKYRQNPNKTANELEIADAILGEMRGNVFLLENASLLETYEESILEMEDDDKNEFVQKINSMAQANGGEKTDYTIDDLNRNTDGVLTSIAAKYMQEDAYGDIFRRWKERNGETEDGENQAETVQGAAQEPKADTAEEVGTKPAKAVRERYAGSGEVRIAGGKQVKDLNLSDEQYAAYKAAEILAPTTGADIEIHESLDKDGKTANGYYDPATNTIHININAKRGSNGKQIALYTLGHETTHYIREWSPAKYDELASFVMDKLGGDTERLVSSKADFLRTISDYQNKTDEEIMELAREEVVADGMELILTDGKVLDELARTDRTLWQKVKVWIENIISKIRKAYADLNQASKTAQTLRETLDSLEEIERLFTEGVKYAGEQTRAVREETADRKYSIDEENATDTNVGRKDAESPDVSEKSIESLEAQNQKLTKQLQKMQLEQFRRAVKDGEISAKMKRQAISKGADEALNSIGVTDGRNRRELVRRMEEIYAHMAAEHGISYEEAFSESEQVASWLISQQPLVRDAEMAEQAKEILQNVHGTKIKLSGKQAFEVASQYGSVNEYRKAMMGKTSITDDGTPLDTLWEEWSDQYPEVFDPETAEADMPERLKALYESLMDQRDRVETIDEYIDETQLANTIFSGVAQIWSEADSVILNDHATLAQALYGTAQSEQEYRTIKRYEEKAEDIAGMEARLAELRKKTATVNKEIALLQSKLRGVDKTKREPWVMTALTEATRRKGELLDEMDGLSRKIQSETDRLLSLRATAPIRRALNEANKRADAMERKAEKAEQRSKDYKAKMDEQTKQSTERKEITIRKRATMRILGQINTMLYHPTKTKHVPAELQELAQIVLKSVNQKDFEKNRNNLREMGELATKIEQDERKVAKTAKEQETMEKRKSKYEHLEAETLSTKRQAEVLLTAFEDYQKKMSEGTAFDQALIDSMSEEVKKIEDVPMTEMGLKSLEAVERFCTLLKHQIDNANKTFATERSLDIDDLGRKAASETQENKPLKVLSPKGMEIAGFERVRKYFWKNMKPMTVFEAIGSKTFADLFQNVLNGEDVWARDIVEAKDKIQKAREKYQYKDWDLDERRAVKTKDGTVNLSLSEIMSLYAYSFRKQAVSHLEGGGFILDADATTKAKGEKFSMVALERRLNDSKRYVLDELLMGEIAGMLTNEQKEYVREMQKYLTSLGEKGNTVSRKLYGIDIFTESDYFPIKVKSEYLKSQTGKSGDPNIKNRGITKEVVPNAQDPLVLQGFDEIMVDHINSMATYHAFVLPIEDLTRVLNYKPMNVKRDENGNPILDEKGMPMADDKAEADYSTLKAVIESKYGATANEYIVQLIRDLNGGARRDAAVGIIDRGITAFKRASTMASLSVLVQQPTSLFRALAYIDAKYLFGNSSIVDFKNHKDLWERVKKYAPVAIIKEMGGYDTGVGARTEDYLNATKYEKGERMKGFATDANYRSELFGIGAAYADEMAWIQLFEACVSEQADKLNEDRNSEKVLEAAGKRFEEVVRRTQVYDSTLTRSEYMRSKDTGAKMATAFMAEPTTIVSMVTDAIIKAERGDKKFLRKTAGAISLAVIVNALAASLVYAMRDDDEDETYTEKYISSVALETADALNPLSYLPVARDIVSIMQGYEVERSDLTLVSNLIDQIEMIQSSKRSVTDKVIGVSGAVSAFFGVPVTNIYRDAKGIVNTIAGQVDTEKTTSAGISTAVKKEFTTIFGLFDEKTKNEYQLYEAAVKGDESQYNRVAARYASEKDSELALRQALRDNDRRINEAAQARISGELDLYKSIIEKIEKEGRFDRNIIIRAVNNEMDSIKRDSEKGTVPKDENAAVESEEEEINETLYKTSDLNEAIERGDTDDYKDVYASLLADRMDAGKSEAEARSSIKSAVTAYWKKKYLTAWENNDTKELKRIQSVLQETGLYGSRNDIAEIGKKWIQTYASPKK